MTATTTTTTATAATPIVGLDLGKYKSVACLYDPAVPDQARFVSFTTCRDELRKLFARCRPGVVVIEACLLAGWVSDFCAEQGLVCKVANTASEAWKFKHTKRKTDRDDARWVRARSGGFADRAPLLAGCIHRETHSHPRTPLRPNDEVQQRGRLQRLHVAESHNAGPVCWNAWFGGQPRKTGDQFPGMSSASRHLWTLRNKRSSPQ